MKLHEVAKTELEKLLAELKIKDYTIRDDGLVDVNGDVRILNKSISKFPLKFGTVTGNFDCAGCTMLTTLEGAPLEVHGDFDCSYNHGLSDLMYSPSIVHGNFKCREMFGLKSLKGGPKEVGSFNCSDNELLKSLEHAPKLVHGNFDCSMCWTLKSLDGVPSVLENGSFDCSSCVSLKTLECQLKSVAGNFDCSNCTELTYLKSSLEEIGGDYYCHTNSNLESFDNLPKHMNGRLVIYDLPKIKNWLKIFSTRGITSIIHNDEKFQKIVNKYIKQRDMIGCQDELIDYGLEEYARTK